MRETTNRFESKLLAAVLQRNFLNLKNDSKKLFILPLFILTMLFAQQSYAALTVTVTYTGSAPTGGTLISGSPFSTLSAAITQLNAVTSVTGCTGITLTCSASGTETATAGGYSITNLLGSATCPIVIEGNASTITAGLQTSASLTDGIFKIVGSDYITIQNFTLKENASNVTTTSASNTMTEFAIGLFMATATNGAQNNTIQNNTITLGATYPNAIGVFSTSSSSVTNGVLAASSALGTNSNNKIYNNTISSVNFGIYFICVPVTATILESGNDFGGSSASNGNRITFGILGTPTIIYNRASNSINGGIVYRNGADFSARFNTITSNSLAYTLSAGLNGIAVSSGTAPSTAYTATISNNNITLTSTGVQPIYGIDFGHGLATNATFNASNNRVTINQNSGAANAAAVNGIRASYSSGEKTISTDTIVINQTPTVGSTTSTVTAINAGTNAGTTVNVTNCILTIKQEIAGSGSFGAGAITYVDVSASSATVNVTGNILNTTGSSIRSTGTKYGINHNGSYTTALNVNNNHINIDANTATGILYGTYSNGSSGISTYNINSNKVVLIAGASTSNVAGIYNTDGGSPTKTFNNNNINISGAANPVYGIFTRRGTSNIDTDTISISTSAVSPILYGIFCTTSGTAFSITNNLINSLNASAASTSAPTVMGINTAVSAPYTISGNVITGITTGAGSGSATIIGLNVGAGTTTTVSKNKIYDLSTACTGTATVISGIRVTAGTTTNIHNNYIGQGIALTGVNNASDAVRGINITSSTASSTINVYYNTIYLNTSSTGANFGTSALFHTFNTTATTAALDMRNNILVNTSTPSGTGITAAFSRSANTDLNNFATTSNNNLLYTAATPSATRVIFNSAGTVSQTLANYLSAVGSTREAASVTELPPFLSTSGASATYLHIDAVTATQVESGAAAISGYIDDYDAASVRTGYPLGGQVNGGGVAPDIGADEGDFKLARPIITALSTPTATCTATAHTVTVTCTTPIGTISSAAITYNNGTLNSNVAMTYVSGSGLGPYVYSFSIPAASPTNTTVSWSCTVTNSAGLISAVSNGTSYQDDPNFGITATATATPSTICAGNATSLSVSVTRNSSLILGAGSLTSTSAPFNPFNGGYGGMKGQYLVRASELTALGLTAGNITALTLYVSAIGTTYNGFVVQIGNTALTDLTSSTIQGSLSTVKTAFNFAPTAGANAITFDTPFSWDGSSNIIVSTSWSNANTSNTSATIFYDATSFQSAVSYRKDNETAVNMLAFTGATGAGTSIYNNSSNRPRFGFTGNTAPAPTAFTWSDGSASVGTTNPLSQSPSTNTSYTCTATVNGCPVVSNTVAVVVTNVAPPTAVTSSSFQCGSAIPTVSVTPSGSGVAGDLRWYDASSAGTLLQTGGTTYGTAISSNTTFYVAQVSGSCESTTRTALTVTVVSPDALSASATSTSICQGASIDLSTSQTGSTNSYALTWTSSPVSGSGIGAGGTSGSLSPSVTTVTPTAPGTFIYTITGVDGSCTATNTVSVTVGAAPAITTSPSNASIAVGANTSFTVVASNTPTSYVWEVNTGSGWTTVMNGGVYTNATTATLNITGATFAMNGYQYRVTASNSCGSSTVSATATLTVTIVYCTPSSSGTATYINSFSTSSGLTNISNLTTGYTTGGYINYSASLSASQYQNTAITCNITYVGGTAGLGIWVDWNNNGSFLDAGENVYNTSGCVATGTYNPSFTIPTSQPVGNYRMRVVVDYAGCTPTPCAIAGTRGEVEDYTVTVVALPACSGTPSAGTVTVTPSSGVAGSTYGVTAGGYTTGTGLTYQWQYSDNGTSWTNQGTATSSYAALSGLTAPAFGIVRQWRLLLTCTNSGLSASTATPGTFTSTYCASTSTSSTGFINSFSTTGGITNITNNTTGYTTGGYTNYSAQSVSQYAATAINFSLSLGSGTGLGTGIAIFVDWNNDGDFLDSGESVYAPGAYSYTTVNTGSFTVPSGQAVGNYRMRAVTNYNSASPVSCNSGITGETEDYTVTVVALAVCSGSPNAGTVVYSGATLCANVDSATITNSGFTTGFSGLTYQWLSSNDNFATDTSSVSGGSNPASLSTGALTATTSYLVRAFCSNSGIYSYSNKITVPVNAPAISSTVPASRCDAGTLTISATGTSGSTIRWYSAITAGTLLQTGTAGSGADAYTTASLPYTSNNNYYVEALNGTCTSKPRTAVTANVVPPTTNPTISPSPTVTICRDSILTLNATGSTVATTTLLYEGFESTTFLPSTFNVPTPNGDGDYFQSSSYYFEGSKAIGLYSLTDYWSWFGLSGDAGVVNMVQAIPMNLSNYLDAKLTFNHICATEDGYDFGIVQYNDGTGWKNFPSSAYTGSATLADANGNLSITDEVAFDKASYTDWDATFTDDLYDYLDISATGYDPGNSSALWKRESIDLTPFMTNNFRVRFRYTFDDITDYYGWLIDSIAITGNQAIKYAWSPNTGLYTNAAATTAYDSLTTPNAATVYAKPTATTTYKAIAYTGNSPATCSGNASITVNVTQKPTATIDAARPYVCDATAQLSVSAATPPTATFNWTRTSGTGSASATGNPATVSGLAGTTVYDVKGTNGVCVDIPLGTSTVVLPAIDNSNIANSPSAGVSVCNYCVYADGNTKTYYNSTDGKIIAAITDETANASSLGETEICFKVDGSVPSVIDNLGNTQPFLQRVWTINPTAGSTATITLYFTAAELAALQAAANSGAYQFSGLGSLGITKYANGGTAFTPNYTPPASAGGVVVPAVFSSFGAGYQAQFQVSNFSTFYMHPLLFPFGALPVELVSFTGWNAGAVNQLQWITVTELNSQKFVVEKRIEGGSFTYLSELPAAGNSNQLLTYELSDANPVVGNNYYRLKIIDIDGSFSYSNIINIPVGDVVKNGFNRVYPNPTGGNLNVEINSTASYNTKVSVYDVLGSVVYKQSKSLIKGVNFVQFDFSSFAKGAYIINFTDNTGKSHTTKFVKD